MHGERGNFELKALYKRMSVVLIVGMLLQVLIPAGLLMTKVSADGGAGDNLVPNGGFEDVVHTTDASWIGGLKPNGWGAWLASKNGKVSVTDAVYHSGAYSVQIEHTGSDRTGLSINVPVSEEGNYKLSAWIRTQDVVSSGGVFVRTNFYRSVNGMDGATKDDKLGDGPVTSKMAGTHDWTLQQVVVPVPAGARYVRLEPFFETGTGTVWFDDVRLERWGGITGLDLQPKTISLHQGDTAVLTPVITPQDAAGQTLIWTSSDPNVASVDEGNVTANDYGTTTITVATADGLIRAEAFVTVESAEMLDGYDALRQRWHTKLIGGESMDMSDSDVRSYIDNLSNRISNPQATGIWDLMDKTPGAQNLWVGGISRDNTDSAVITKAYTMIKDMATAYSTEGTAQYSNPALKDDIILALDWMNAYQYNESKKIVGNWWDWEIGTPQALMDILVLMYDDLSEGQIARNLKVIDTFVPDPTKRVQNGSVTETGANLLDKALVVVLRGVVGKQSFKIEQGENAIYSELQYAKKGDGIYEDGSLIQHTNIAYTGSYGGVLIGRMADLLYLFNASPWEINDPRVSHVYRWVEDSFEALIYKGAMMDNVRGRSISRQSDSDHLTGRAIIRTLARLAEGAPAEQSIKIKSMIKEWVQSDTTFSNYYENMPVYEMNLIKAIANDSSVAARGELVKHQNFAAMDRVVHLRKDYGFALSMFSQRISAFEYGNGENKQGWYTGIGMTSLYNNDLSQYSNQYWPTVDMLRLPGTTTDGYAPAPKDWASYYNPRAWVGGSTLDGQFGASGMNYSLKDSTGSDLQGKKSWFMFDDEIVAIGSDISGSANRKVETIVENRQINDSGSNNLVVDGQVKPATPGWEETLKGISWAHLQGNVSGADIGYYFPETADIDGKREARTGSWKNVNNDGSADPITRNYLSLAFEHGSAPKNGSYAYVLLPNKGVAETEQYSLNPDIEIMSQSSQVHSARDKKLGISAFNFWDAGKSEFVRASGPASVMVKEEGNKLTVSVSDPTQTQNKVLVDLGKVVLKELTKDPSVTVVQTEPYLKLEINTQDSLGRSYEIQFEYDPQQAPELEGEPEGPGQVEKTEVYVSEDAFVQEGADVNTNFGTRSYMDIKNGTGSYLRKAFLKFDMSGIPADREIESAQLFIYGGVNDSRTQNAGVSVHAVESNNWSETALTWNNMPAIGALLEKISADKEYQWRQFDVTSFAQSRLKLDGQMSLALQGDSDLTVTFKSKEGDGGIYKSYLEITYKPNVPVSGISLSSEQAVLVAGESINLKAALVPLNATNKELAWSVDRSDVLKLEANESEAMITALQPGRAKVTVTTADGKLSAVCEVQVVLSKTTGDLNGDGKVTVGDLGIAAASFGKNSASPDWEAVEAADINGDGVIDSADLKWFADQILQ